MLSHNTKRKKKFKVIDSNQLSLLNLVIKISILKETCGEYELNDAMVHGTFFNCL